MIVFQATCLTLYHTIPTFNDPEEGAYRKHCGKGENAGNQHFLLFPQCFLDLPFPRQISIFDLHQFCRLQMLSVWTSLQTLSVSKELKAAPQLQLLLHPMQGIIRVLDVYSVIFNLFNV